MEGFWEQFFYGGKALSILLVLDKIAFVFYLVAVCYLFLFALGSVLRKGKKVYPEARKNYRYAVIFFLDYKDETVFEALDAFRKQLFPRLSYDLIVVSNLSHEQISERLKCCEDVWLMVMPVEHCSKTEAVQFAMTQLDGHSYDVAVVMDGDCVVEEDFLREVNNAYYSGGMAIQTHRRARNLDSNLALLGAASEEINNAIFRKGHVNLGFSSALIGSGMAFKFDWLRDNIRQATNEDLSKQLETMLLEQFTFIDYLSEVSVYVEKADRASEFFQQRKSWITNRVQNAKMLLQKFPVALFKGNFDYCDKLFQWLLPSRTILIGTLLLITILLLILSWGLAIKWIVILLMLIFSFSIAMPDYLIDARFVKALRKAPVLFMLTVFNVIRRKLSRPRE